MNAPTFTPGPWRDCGGGKIRSESYISETPIARVHKQKRHDNRNVVVAAPDMFHVLELIYANAAESPEWIRERIGPVLAKATGNR